MGKMEELQSLIRNFGKEIGESNQRFRELEKAVAAADTLEEKERIIKEFKEKKK